MIERLVIERDGREKRDSEAILHEENSILRKVINQIASFNNLKSLSINHFNFSPDLMRALVQRLPTLNFLQFNFNSSYKCFITSNDILFVFTECIHLKKFVIQTTKFDECEPYFDLNFHHEFTKLARSKGDIIVFIYRNEDDKIVVTNEKLQRNRELRY